MTGGQDEVEGRGNEEDERRYGTRDVHPTQNLLDRGPDLREGSRPNGDEVAEPPRPSRTLTSPLTKLSLYHPVLGRFCPRSLREISTTRP